MITVDLAALLERVSPFCRSTVEEAGSLCGGGLGRRRVLGVVGQEGVVKAMNLAYSYTMRLGGERSLDAEDCSV